MTVIIFDSCIQVLTQFSVPLVVFLACLITQYIGGKGSLKLATVIREKSKSSTVNNVKVPSVLRAGADVVAFLHACFASLLSVFVIAVTNIPRLRSILNFDYFSAANE